MNPALPATKSMFKQKADLSGLLSFSCPLLAFLAFAFFGLAGFGLTNINFADLGFARFGFVLGMSRVGGVRVMRVVGVFIPAFVLPVVRLFGFYPHAFAVVEDDHFPRSGLRPFVGGTGSE